MQKPSMRNQRVADLIHRQVALLIKNEVSDPRLTQMILTTVTLSSDLSSACIYYTVPGGVNHDDVVTALKKATGFIRHGLSVRTKLRYTPHISFCYDESIERAQRILSLINNIDIPSDD